MIVDAVSDVVAPVAESLGLTVYDIEMAGSTLRVSLDGPDGVDLDALAEANRRIGRDLDLVDPIPGRYTLEVSSPGLERRLRTDAHFRGAIGEPVKIKLRRESDGERRVVGVVESVSDGSVDIRPTDGSASRTLVIDDIQSARTTFEWAPSPKPGGPRRRQDADEATGIPDVTPTPSEESEAS